jgi:hypothetical protein
MRNKKIVYFTKVPEFINILGTEVALVDRCEFTDAIIMKNIDNSFETLDTIYIPMHDEDFYLGRTGC